MKQTTQKFLARLLALLLVLGLAPEVWAEYGSSTAQAAGANGVYLWCDDFTGDNRYVTNKTVPIYWYNGYSGTRRLSVGTTGSTQISSVTWTIGSVTINSTSSTSPTYVSNYLSAYLVGQELVIVTYGGYVDYNSYTVTARINGTASTYSCTVYTGDNNNNNYGSTLASVVVNGSYYLGETDANGKSSIVSQLDYYSNSYNRLAYVRFTSTSHTYGSLNASTYTQYWADRYSTSSYNYLSNVLFTPSNSTGTAYFGIEAYYYTNGVNGNVSTTPVRGSIAIDSRGGATSTIGDITYPATTTASIFKADIDQTKVTAPAAATGLTYTGKPLALVTAGSSPEGTMEYSLDDKSYSVSLPTGTDAGDYDVWYRVKGDSNHNDTAGAKLDDKVTIAKQEVTAPIIEFIPSGAAYNGSVQRPVVVVKDANGRVIPDSEYTVAYGSTDWTNAGDHEVTVTGKTEGNYNITTKTEKFTITPWARTHFPLPTSPARFSMATALPSVQQVVLERGPWIGLALTRRLPPSTKTVW